MFRCVAAAVTGVRCAPTTRPPTGTKVDAVTPAAGGAPARVQLAGGGSISARRGVVVAVEGPEAARILGTALQVRFGAFDDMCVWCMCACVCACVLACWRVCGRGSALWRGQSHTTARGAAVVLTHSHTHTPSAGRAEQAAAGRGHLQPLLQGASGAVPRQHPVPERHGPGAGQQLLLPLHRGTQLCAPRAGVLLRVCACVCTRGGGEGGGVSECAHVLAAAARNCSAPGPATPAQI
jgi:hypothetical protein